MGVETRWLELAHLRQNSRETSCEKWTAISSGNGLPLQLPNSFTGGCAAVYRCLDKVSRRANFRVLGNFASPQSLVHPLPLRLTGRLAIAKRQESRHVTTRAWIFFERDSRSLHFVKRNYRRDVKKTAGKFEASNSNFPSRYLGMILIIEE